MYNLEVDPNGLKPNEPGAKLDLNKPDMDLVLGAFARALIEVAKVGTFGAKKYSRDGWLSVPNGRKRYRSAELRHHFYEDKGELYDSESGLTHASHEVWCALAQLELLLRDIENELPKTTDDGQGKPIQ